MDGTKPTSITAQDLRESVGTAAAPIIVDVRQTAAFGADDKLVVGAIRRPPDALELRCIRIYGISDPALDRLALIVRSADTGHPELTPQSPGLLALSQGLSANFPDDHAMLKQGIVMYDALYAWCRAQSAKPSS